MNTPTGRQRTDRLRAMPLTDILRAIDAQPDPHDPVKWHTPRGVLSVNGAKFFNWNEAAGGGGAIDLVMHLKCLCFKDAMDWLAQRFPTTAPQPQVAPASQSAPRLPSPQPAHLGRVTRYLIEQRRLPAALLAQLLQTGRLYADARANAVFLLLGNDHRAVGAELRGTTEAPWRGLAPGSRKDLGYFSCGPTLAHELVLCESAIDAISCRTLYPQRLCISTAGARANPAWLPAILARGLTTYCGFDADPTGEHMAQAMIALHPSIQRLRPSHHDWNDTLRARA